MIKLIKNNYSELILLIVAFFSVYIGESIANEWQYLSIKFYIINVFIVYILERTLLVFIRSISLTCIIAIVLNLVLGIGEYVVAEFRGTAIMPWDFLALSTAKSVSSSYTFVQPDYFFFYIVSSVLFIFLLMFLKLKRNSRILWKINNIILVVIMITIFNKNIYAILGYNIWDTIGQLHEQGIDASIISYSRYMNYNKPKGYSKKKAKEILNNCEVVKGEKNKARNIIIIMNESFSDLKVYNDKFQSEKYMSSIESIKDNIIKGNLFVPVFGAGTSETEFEFLTGISTRDVPYTPYVTAIYHDIDSFARKTKENGYDTIAFHPYLATNWNRKAVYPRIGFDKFYSLEDVESYETPNWGCDDKSDYKKIIDFIDNEDNPTCIFNVTMQNHGGYLEPQTSDFLIDDKELTAYPETKTYLSLIKLSDEAILNLINYYKDKDENTIICFFGDHQASIEEEYYEFLYGKSIKELSEEESMVRYITPFFIWANYDIQEQYIDRISINFLSDLVMINAGIDLHGYESFTYNLYKKYPVITKTGIIDADGNYYNNESLIDDQLIMDYKYLEYYRMHNKY